MTNIPHRDEIMLALMIEQRKTQEGKQVLYGGMGVREATDLLHILS